MYNHQLHQKIQINIKALKLDITDKDNVFYSSFIANIATIQKLYFDLYGHHSNAENLFDDLIKTIATSYANRSDSLK